jgi:undecaprenyl-diphosphatase
MMRLILSILPVLTLGLLITSPRGVAVIAVCSIVFGILLWLADKYGANGREVSPATALIAGLAQVVALVPGVSRSGITISAMRARGVERTEALNFAFLMSMPAIAAAGGWEFIQAVKSPEMVNWTAAGLVVAISAVFSLLAIRFMLKLVKKFSFVGFAIYRVLLGVILLAFYA